MKKRGNFVQKYAKILFILHPKSQSVKKTFDLTATGCTGFSLYATGFSLQRIELAT
ncbi:MAG: hypothetical protein IPN94_15765 [Sphingobacteriales bacterium]|nr:hypothetical protein [Sphingobacteriales bacterium]